MTSAVTLTSCFKKNDDKSQDVADRAQMFVNNINSKRSKNNEKNIKDIKGIVNPCVYIGRLLSKDITCRLNRVENLKSYQSTNIHLRFSSVELQKLDKTPKSINIHKKCCFRGAVAD